MPDFLVQPGKVYRVGNQIGFEPLLLPLRTLAETTWDDDPVSAAYIWGPGKILRITKEAKRSLMITDARTGTKSILMGNVLEETLQDGMFFHSPAGEEILVLRIICVRTKSYPESYFDGMSTSNLQEQFVFPLTLSPDDEVWRNDELLPKKLQPAYVDAI